MKNKHYILLVVIIFSLLYSTISIAQTESDENIWSVVKVNPNITKTILPKNYWTPAEQVAMFIPLLDGITVSPNFRLKPGSNTTQSEMSVDIHPSNNNIVFGSANTTDWPMTTLFGTGVYWSLNGGTTWTGYDNPPFSSYCDPASVIGFDGKFYQNFITNSNGQGVAISTNNGVNWNSYTIAPNPGSVADKNHFMVDKKSGSPYVNRSYCGWTDFGGTNNYDVVLRYSTNFGQTWSATSINLSNALSSYLNQGINIQTGPNGEVYAVWAVYLDSNVGTGEDGIGFAKSTNGGVTWSTPTYVYQQTNFGIRGYLSSKNSIRVSSFPSMAVDRSGGPYNGYIYVSWPQRGVSPAGSDPDIVMVRSTNGGTNWSTPVRVNNDPLNNGKDQYYSWCTVDQATGQFMIVFYDSRDVANNQANVYMARSLDGGVNFENFKVSDQPHTPLPIAGLAGGYAGDYIGLAAYDDVAYPLWADNRTGNYQGWMAKVTFGPPCPVGVPSNPIPVNGATNVSVTIPQISWTNGTGTTQCEVWFGVSGGMSKVYDGSLISSWTIPTPLNYSTSYNWQIVDKNDTCSSIGSNWSFTTELSPGVIFTENFDNLNCWTAIGPLGTTNWSTNSSANAGGTVPELRLNWSPEFNGLSKLKSCAISVLNNRHYTVTLKHMLDFYATTAPNLGLAVSYDDGTTYNSIWSFTPTSNVGPETIEASFTTPVNDSPEAINLTLVLFCNGNSYNIDYWYIDDIILTDDDYLNLLDPTNVLATAISYSQINISFTPNGNNNNVVMVWNNTGTFTTPSGTPPVIGQPFAGGTLLYNGTTSPVNHTGLTQQTTYYYKAFSYNGISYSSGVSTSAATLTALDFAVNLLLFDNCSNSYPIIFGTAPIATECFDAGLDVLAPPPPPISAFDGRFISCGEGMFTDIKGTNPDGESIWNVHYQPAENCSPVSISWDPAQLPAGGYFHLVDPGSSNLVNVNMRTTNTYSDAQELGYLKIKYNYQICSNYNEASGWNMISLPINVTNNNYQTLFPNAVAGTLFGYSGTYYSTTTIQNSIGYWLKFPSTQTVQVCGLDRTECVINLNTGWNMIGGPNCNVPLNSVGDPGGIIVPGTLYGYSGGYFTSNSIDATKAYWIKASGSGTITVSCGSVVDKERKELQIPKEAAAEFSEIEIKDGQKNSQRLYYNGKLDEEIKIESFSLPPVGPEGSFDARIAGDYRLSENDEVSIQLQASSYPVSVVITNLKDDGEYELVEISEGEEVGTHKVTEGEKIVITNEEVRVLRIKKQGSIPTTYNLEQNYPNPFNPSTTIKFSLPEAANATLTIYNALGQKITELINTNLEAGRYSYRWDASNVASGIYIYELRTDKFISIKKMILMK